MRRSAMELVRLFTRHDSSFHVNVDEKKKCSIEHNVCVRVAFESLLYNNSNKQLAPHNRRALYMSVSSEPMCETNRN